MNTHDTIKERIRKLLNLADGSTHDGEIDNALRFAQRLMDAHQLTRAQILDDPDGADSLANEQMAREAAYTGSAKVSHWEGTLVMAVCQVVGSVQVYADRHHNGRTADGLFIGHDRPRAAMQFFGMAEDVSLAVALFTDTRQTITAMARLKFGGVYRGEGRSYCEGFTRALYRKTEETATERTAQCSAIIETTSGKALAWLNTEHDIKLSKSSGGSGGRHFGDANAEGRSDGQRCGFSANRRAKLTGSTRGERLRLT